MEWRASDVVPISETRARLTELVGLVLVQGVLEGLEDLTAGRVFDEAQFDQALSRPAAGPRKNSERA